MIHRMFVAFCLVFSHALEASAQTVSVRFDIEPSRAQQYGLDPDEVQEQLDAVLRRNLHLDTLQPFMDSMANAAAMSSKGMGVDYASNVDNFVLGVSLGSGVQDTGVRFSRGSDTLPVGGFAAQFSVMAGANLGALIGADDDDFTRRLLIYVNGMSLRAPSEAAFEDSMLQLGAHAQLRVINPVHVGFAEWGGLALTVGWERSQYELALARPLPLSTDVRGHHVTWKAGGTYTVGSAVDALPIEVSTNGRLAFLTLFAGAGVDLNAGRSRASATLAGPVTVRGNGEDVLLGNAEVTGRATGIADDLVPRAFGGAQLELFVLKVYGHLNVGANGAIGGHTGVRLVF